MAESIGFPRLSGNMLKLIACAAMFADHFAVMCCPDEDILRIIGRLAFPIFAFMIAEGARYTHNRLRYFLTIFIEGFLMQLVYIFLFNDDYLSIFITFSISILLIYAFDYMKRAFIFSNPIGIRIFSVVLFVGGVIAAYFFCREFQVDYGFCGVMTPVITSTFMHKGDVPAELRRLDVVPIHVLACGAALLVLAVSGDWDIQYYSLLTLPLLLLYSGKRGSAKLKWFFYIFYPVHMVVIAALALILRAVL